jgi:hypothetical protein
LLAALVGAGGLIGAAMATGPASTPSATPTPSASASAHTTAPPPSSTASPGGPLRFGNPKGNAYVPPAARAVDTSHPNHVIGTGTPASCTSAAVVRAVAKGGVITFNCGKLPVTIVMSQTANVRKTTRHVVLDGGGLITLSGNGQRRILYSNTCAGQWSTSNCTDQPFPAITVQNITFAHAYDGAIQTGCTSNTPSCWYGGWDGGGAIYAEGGQFKAVNTRFLDNGCYRSGPDLGGGAIRALVQYQNRPVYITDSTFRGGHCSNGGALSSISVQWDIYNSVFTGNRAVGFGANPAAGGTPGGGSGGAIYNDGADYDLTIAGTIMRNNTASEGGGAIFYVVNTGWGTLTLNGSQLSRNVSHGFQNFPGIFDHVDGNNVNPVVINSIVH